MKLRIPHIHGGTPPQYLIRLFSPLITNMIFMTLKPHEQHEIVLIMYSQVRHFWQVSQVRYIRPDLVNIAADIVFFGNWGHFVSVYVAG